jgi:hypothetical protein
MEDAEPYQDPGFPLIMTLQGKFSSIMIVIK